MNAARPAELLRHLEQTGAADADLLARFVASADGGAFAELVRRHGALVLGVCRRVTAHRQDAEDAFQATFLVLAQKAASLQNAALLGNWLYGVAYRVARRARRAAARRRAREIAVAELPEPLALPAPPPSELTPILDEELAALPAHYRDAIILCDLRSASRAEAAAALGVPEGTLSSRLANGRKKLAARLTKRGVALSAAALPLALADAQGGAIVPAELTTRACALAADFAAGGALPAVLAHLIKGGFAMRNALVLGVLMAATVAGAVLATQPRPAPPADPAMPPVVAVKPRPKDEPQAKEDAVAFTDRPKLHRSFDLGMTGFLTLRWNARGTHLAIGGRQPAANVIGEAATGEGVRLVALGTDVWLPPAKLGDNSRLVDVLPDGDGFVTAVREYKLISGRHQLNFWTTAEAEARPAGPGANHFAEVSVARTVALALPETHGYAFAANMKTFRTVASARNGSGAVTKLEVIEVDATTGKASKSLLMLDNGVYALSANGKRFATLSDDATKVTVHDVDNGAKLSEHTFTDKKDVTLPDGKTVKLDPLQAHNSFLVFSPDGRRLVVSRDIGRTTVLNTDTGEALPPPEGVALARTFPDTNAFTSDGRLLVATCEVYEAKFYPGGPRGGEKEPKEQAAIRAIGKVLTVWDTQTGKALKTWKSGEGVRVAFNPARPLLAILEPNGAGGTRVGFWDFAAEVEKN